MFRKKLIQFQTITPMVLEVTPAADEALYFPCGEAPLRQLLVPEESIILFPQKGAGGGRY